jgi:hypothetical protein
VVLESLDSLEPLAGWRPVAQRAVEVPNDPDAAVWHVCWYQVDERSLSAGLDSLALAMRPHWYAHFWEGDDLCVILSGRFFWAKASDRLTWHDFIAYGDKVGVHRKWTERVPTQLPTWVQDALQKPMIE